MGGGRARWEQVRQATAMIAATACLAGLIHAVSAPRLNWEGRLIPGIFWQELDLVSRCILPTVYLLARPYLYYAHWAVIACALLVVASAFCLGRAFLGVLASVVLGARDRAPLHGLERLLLELATGFWLQSVLLFFAFTLHWGKAVLAGCVVLVVAAPLVFGERALSELGKEWLQWRRARKREARWGRVPASDRLLNICAGVCFALSGIMALAPPHQTDALRYHLSVPDLWLRHGGFVYLPHVAFSNFPFMIEMLFAIPLALPFSQPLELDAAARLLHWFWYVMLGSGAYVFAARSGGARAGCAARALIAATPFVPPLASWAFVEVALACVVLLALGSAQRYHDAGERSERVWWLVVAGLLSGMALSIKYTAVVVLAGLSLWTLAARRLSWRGRLGSALAVVSIAWLAACPWYLKSLYYTGNPVFPLANTVFNAPDWSPLEASLYFHHARVTKGDLWRVPAMTWFERFNDFVTLPWRCTTEPGQFGNWPAGVGYLGLLPLVWGWSRRGPRCHAFGWAAAWLFAAWAYSYRDTRFLLPCLAAVAVSIGVAYSRALSQRGVASLLCQSLVLVTVGVNMIGVGAGTFAANPVGEGERILGARVFRVVCGAISRQEFLSDPFIADYYPALRSLKNLPGGGLTLIVGQELVYYCPVPYIYSDFFNIPVLVKVCKRADSLEQTRAVLRGMGITRLFVNRQRLNPVGAYRRLYNLYFLPDDRVLDVDSYERYLRGAPEGDALVYEIVATPALQLHDRFLSDSNPYLERIGGEGDFVIYALN